jgi:hypothetical protein
MNDLTPRQLLVYLQHLKSEASKAETKEQVIDLINQGIREVSKFVEDK